uniref:Uncharacterized protein n=1 Tax=Streptomyces sp. NBC_00003 TaxID=2903608 RepID=A0AAU2VAA4_9ACTN
MSGTLSPAQGDRHLSLPGAHIVSTTALGRARRNLAGEHDEIFAALGLKEVTAARSVPAAERGRPQRSAHAGGLCCGRTRRHHIVGSVPAHYKESMAEPAGSRPVIWQLFADNLRRADETQVHGIGASTGAQGGVRRREGH